MFNNFFSLFQNRAVSEIMEKKKFTGAGLTTDVSIIRLMRFACWPTKATYTVRIYNTYCFSTATMVTRTRVSVTRHLYLHCLSFFRVCPADIIIIINIIIISSSYYDVGRVSS